MTRRSSSTDAPGRTQARVRGDVREPVVEDRHGAVDVDPGLVRGHRPGAGTPVRAGPLAASIARQSFDASICTSSLVSSDTNGIRNFMSHALRWIVVSKSPPHTCFLSPGLM